MAQRLRRVDIEQRGVILPLYRGDVSRIFFQQLPCAFIPLQLQQIGKMAAALARAVEAAGKDEAVRAEARKLSLPLAVNDSAVLMETMKRTRRVIQELVHR